MRDHRLGGFLTTWRNLATGNILCNSSSLMFSWFLLGQKTQTAVNICKSLNINLSMVLLMIILPTTKGNMFQTAEKGSANPPVCDSAPWHPNHPQHKKEYRPTLTFTNGIKCTHVHSGFFGVTIWKFSYLKHSAFFGDFLGMLGSDIYQVQNGHSNK